MPRVFNFSAGPAVLPEAVLRQAADEMLDWHGSGMSVMEMSHRGKEFIAIHAEAEALLRELLAVPAGYKVLFLQGGAIGENAIVPMNMLRGKASADYVSTGEWSKKSIAEAKKYARVSVAASGEASKFTSIPPRESWRLDPDAAYVHICANETIGGVEYHFTPDVGDVPLVADMSSDMLWRKFDVTRFGLVYAGAQKNIGPSGVVVVLVSKELVARGRKDIPKIFQLRTPAENKSLYNTPPTFGIYMVRNVLAWLKGIGGLSAIEAQNRKKAARLYGVIDSHSDFYRCPVEKESRSVMNVVFRLPSEQDEERFIAEAKKRDMVGLKGHRSVGGIRASIYNAVQPEWVEELAAFMEEFAKRS